jgi:hypothetical protein
MITRAQAALDNGKFLNEFIPVPEDLAIVAGRVGDDTDPEQISLEAKEKSNRDKYGYANWYDFCVNEWGTKWDVGDEGSTSISEDGTLTASFDSAWAPPIQAYDKLMDLGFEVKAYYYEPGMAFAGVWEDGIDDYYEIGSMNSSEVFDILPEDLNEMFGISDTIEQYEAEEAEDE